MAFAIGAQTYPAPRHERSCLDSLRGLAGGEIVVRREVWRGSPWMAVSVIVVADGSDLLASYLPEGAEFAFAADGHGLGPHPVVGPGGLAGHGVLMLQRPGERYAVWHFWERPGAERSPAGTSTCRSRSAARRSGYDTQDLELDVWIPAAGGWSFKDDELLEVRVGEGRFTAAEAVEIRALGAEIGATLDRGEQWWDPAWSRWRPDPAWAMPAARADGWETAPTT